MVTFMIELKVATHVVQVIHREKHPERMSIWAGEGDLVKFDARGGWDGEKRYALKLLNLGEIYEVESVEVHGSSSYVTLKGYKEQFNTCLFAPVQINEEAAIVRTRCWKR
jgi:hypothetical protein